MILFLFVLVYYYYYYFEHKKKYWHLLADGTNIHDIVRQHLAMLEYVWHVGVFGFYVVL